MTMDSHGAKPRVAPYFWPYHLDEPLRTAASLERLRNAVGAVNPRPPGWYNDLIQLFKKLFARSLTWYTRPLREFNAPVSRLLEQIVRPLDHVSMNVLALEGRMTQSEKRSAALAKSMQEQLERLHEQVETLISLQKAAESGRIPGCPSIRVWATTELLM